MKQKMILIGLAVYAALVSEFLSVYFDMPFPAVLKYVLLVFSLCCSVVILFPGPISSQAQFNSGLLIFHFFLGVAITVSFFVFSPFLPPEVRIDATFGWALLHLLAWMLPVPAFLLVVRKT
jgi:hypothetical protein